MIFTTIWTALVPSVRFDVVNTFKQNWAWLFFVSQIYAFSIATNNVSFAAISLTVNTIFKSAMPFPTMFLSYFIEEKRYSVPIICIVSVLVAATLLAVPWHPRAPEPAPSTQQVGGGTSSHVDHQVPMWVGYVLVIISMIATACRPVVSSHLMRNAEAGGSRQALTATSMAFWDALIAIPILTLGTFLSDVWLRPGVAETFSGELAGRNVALVGIGCLMAGIYGPVTFYTIKLTSSLTFIIIGNFKQLALLTGAALFVDKVTDPLLWCGVAIVALSSLAYAYQTNYEKRIAAEAAAKKANEATPLKSPA